jgi:glyoxylase-like metal-dependent hydrolase (beta-lactamase superfamily II)
MTKGGYSRAYLFEDDDELTLVDTGWDTDAHIILEYLASIDRSPTEIRHIALTHAHRSHLGGLATLAALSGAKVWCHETEAPIIRGDARAHPINLWPPLPVRLVPFRILSWLNLPKHQPWRELTYVGDREIGPLTVIHTPGHTPGHLAFVYRGSVLAAGDAVATWPRLGPGWPGFNLDERLYRASLWKLVQMAPQVVGPGHGDAIVAGAPELLLRLYLM